MGAMEQATASAGNRPQAPVWLRGVVVLVLAVLAGSLVYAALIALANLSRIGV
jgi:hypothetical protein